MTTLSPAASAIVEALKDPTLGAQQAAALIAALRALDVAPTVDAARPTRKTRNLAPVSSAPARRMPVRKADAVHLTREAIGAMPLPTTGEQCIYDTACPQLAVRLRPGGRSFVVVLWDGKRRRAVKHTLGKVTALSPEQARREAQKLVGRVADGEDVRPAVNADLKLSELIAKWHAEKSHKGNRTVDEMKAKALDYLGSLQHRVASEITREHIGAIHHHVATKGRRRVWKLLDGTKQRVEVGDEGIPPTADKWLAITSAIFTWGVGKGLVPSNPCKGIGKAFNARQNARTAYLHGDPLLRFWKALEADPDADVRDALLIGLYTGQRKGNVLAMQWDHVDLAHGLWTIPGEQTKQRKPQTNPLSAQAREILARRHEDAASPWVFPGVRRNAAGDLPHMSVTRPREAWERICKAAGIENLHIHDLRHTAGSWLARLGANEAVRQKALGHQTPAMAARYSHLELDPVADAVQRMGDAIEAAATKKAAPVRSISNKARRR